MKNFGQQVYQEKYKYVTIVWYSVVESVKLMIQEHYDTPEYDDTIIFVNVWRDDNNQAFHPYYFPQKRKIYYCLEHGCDMSDKTELGNPEEKSVNEWAIEIDNIIHPDNAVFQIETKPLPGDDPLQRKPDIAKAKKLLDWEPKVSYIIGLSKTIDYYRNVTKK